MKRKIAYPIIIIAAIAVIVGCIGFDVSFIKWMLQFNGGWSYVVITQGLILLFILIIIVEKK